MSAVLATVLDQKQDATEVYNDFHQEVIAGVTAYVRRRVSGQEDAEDIIQNAMLRLYKLCLKTGLPTESRLRHAWAREHARAAIRDHQRRASRREGLAPTGPSLEDADEPCYAESTEQDEQREWLRLAIDSLPARLSIVMRHQLMGRTHEEISQVLGMSMSSVRRRVQEAVIRLKQKAECLE